MDLINTSSLLYGKTNQYLSKKIRLWCSLFILCFYFWFGTSYAQNDAYRFYNINKIRSNEVIKSISKDEKGFVWLATDQGVLRYDGHETYMFFKELPSPYAKKFLRKRNGDFLVVTDFGIREIAGTEDTTYFKPLSFNGREFPQPLTYPKSAFEDKDGNLWAGEIESIVKISAKGFERYDLGPAFRSINYHRSFSFTEDAFGNLWIAPYKGKLLYYNKEANRLDEVEVEYPVSDVTCIVTVKGDNLLIGGKEGLFRIKVDSDRNISETQYIKAPEDVSAAIAIENDIYIGTWDNGLYHLNFKDKVYQVTKNEDLLFNDVLDFFYDEANEEIWITGSENIGLLKPSLIKPISKAGTIRIESLSCDTSGVLYFSSGQQIYEISADNSSSLRQVVGSKSTYLDRILWDDDKLWIGSALGGISYYDFDQKVLVGLRENSFNAIQYILKDHADQKWFTGHPEELIKIDNNLEISLYKNVRKSAVIKESADNILFCGAQGRDSLLYLYDEKNDRFKILDVALDFIPSADIQVEDIAFDSLNLPWLATNEGLIRLTSNNGKFKGQRVHLKGIDANEPIKAIVIVDDNIWLAYSFALVLFHKGEIITFNRENGLPSRLLKERGLLRNKDKLYVATAKGLAEVDLNSSQYSFTAQPSFKALTINGSKYAFSGKENITLPYGARVQMEFVSLSYPGNNLLYQTRIIGLEDKYSDPSPNNSISLLGFSEGSYSLEVRAREDGKLWSEPLNFKFSIASPWFRSWWAILLFISSGALLIYGGSKMYHYHLIRQRKKLKQIIEARTAEINQQKNQIIEQKNKIIQQKEELIEKNNAVYNSQKALSEADLNYLHLKEKQLQDQISYRNKQITTHTLNIIQKNEMLRELREQLDAIIHSHNGSTNHELKKMLKIIDESFKHDKDWDEFKIYFEQIYTDFYSKLKVNYPELTNQELRHCALIRLNLRNNECASILGISSGSIKVSRNRLKKKLNLDNHESLSDFLMSF